jgi:hypothetical protein
MRPLRLVCLFSMLISTMKRAYFVSMFLCLTTTFFFAQLQLPFDGSHSARRPSRAQVRSDSMFVRGPRAGAGLHHGKVRWLLGRAAISRLRLSL